jgi:hypothetical protein
MRKHLPEIARLTDKVSQLGAELTTESLEVLDKAMGKIEEVKGLLVPGKLGKLSLTIQRLLVQVQVPSAALSTESLQGPLRTACRLWSANTELASKAAELEKAAVLGLRAKRVQALMGLTQQAGKLTELGSASVEMGSLLQEAVAECRGMVIHEVDAKSNEIIATAAQELYGQVSVCDEGIRSKPFDKTSLDWVQIVEELGGKENEETSTVHDFVSDTAGMPTRRRLTSTARKRSRGGRKKTNRLCFTNH